MKSPQRHGAGFDPPIIFVLVLCQMPQVVPKCPSTTFAQNKKCYPQNMFLRLCDATSPYKNLVKNWENEVFPAFDSEANFSAPSTVQFLKVKAGAMGMVLAVSFFLAIKGRPAMMFRGKRAQRQLEAFSHLTRPAFSCSTPTFFGVSGPAQKAVLVPFFIVP